MKTKHTQGPWELKQYARSNKYYVAPSIGGGVLHECVDARMEDMANARLIASAPDLLEALQCAQAALTQNKVYPADVALALLAIKAAITKATGEAV